MCASLYGGALIMQVFPPSHVPEAQLLLGRRGRRGRRKGGGEKGGLGEVLRFHEDGLSLQLLHASHS